MERWRVGAIAAAAGFVAGVTGTVLASWTVRRLMRSEGVQAMRRRKTGSDTRGMKLYHSFPFRSSRCAWLLEEMGKTEEVEIVPVSLHGSEASDLMTYRTVHPHGTLPALVLRDGSVLLESSAICLYLADNLTCPDGTTLLPDKQQQAHYYNIICYATSTFDIILEPLYMQLTHTPVNQRNTGLVDTMTRKFHICANVLSSHLCGQGFVCGDKFTAADCVVGFNVWWASVIEGGVLLEEYPVLRDYLARLQARPAFEATLKGKKPVKPSGGSL
jgi:glutathione S-transferase